MTKSKAARNQLVAKRNDMIQQSRLSLTLTQSKAISYILSKVKKGDTEETHYFFNISEFKNIMKLKKITYKEVAEMLQNIADQSTYIVDKTGELRLIRWLDIVHIEPVDGKIELTLHKDITPYVFNLIEQKDENGEYYTTYMLQDISLMKHFYSPRVYEILKSYAYNNEQWRFEFNTGSVRDIQVLIAKPDTNGEPVIPKSWSSWAVFKRDVLEPAKIAYKESKYDLYGSKQRRICSIEFYMLEKTNGEKRITEDIIEQEYKEVDEEEAQQMSIFDEFYNAHREQMEKEAVEELIEQEDELERRQERSMCPIFLGDFSEFSDDEVESLYKAALGHIAFGIFSVKKKNWDEREMWAIDFVSYYYEKIQATKNDTRTTTFNRLYDSILKDYDNYSNKVNQDYILRYGD